MCVCVSYVYIHNVCVYVIVLLYQQCVVVVVVFVAASDCGTPN